MLICLTTIKLFILLLCFNPMTDKPKYYLSLDIEGEGDRFNNSIIAIGACVGPAEGSWNREHLLKFRGNLKPLPGDTPDPKTISEFWVCQYWFLSPGCVPLFCRIAFQMSTRKSKTEQRMRPLSWGSYFSSAKA